MDKKRTEKPVGEKGQGEAITGLSVEVLEYLTGLSVSESPKQIRRYRRQLSTKPAGNRGVPQKITKEGRTGHEGGGQITGAQLRYQF